MSDIDNDESGDKSKVVDLTGSSVVQNRASNPNRQPRAVGGNWYWPKQKIEYYRQVFLKYLEVRSLSPQSLYDMIMEPEISYEIERAFREDGIRLTRVEARPHPDGAGRDLVRNWLLRYPYSVTEMFLPFAERFILQRVPEEQRNPIDNDLYEARRRYHLMALCDMVGASRLGPPVSELINPHRGNAFAMVDLGDDEKVYKIISFSFLEHNVGEFFVFRLGDRLSGFKESHLFDCEAGLFKKNDLKLVARGYCWALVRKSEHKDAYGVDMETLFVDHFYDTGIATEDPMMAQLPHRGRSLGEIDLTISRNPSRGISKDPHAGYRFQNGLMYVNKYAPYQERVRLRSLDLNAAQVEAIKKVARSYRYE